MRRVFLAAGLAGSIALAGCGEGSDPGMPTAEENEQMNQIAEELDTSPDDAVPAEDLELGNGEEESAEGGDVAVVNEGNAAAENGQ